MGYFVVEDVEVTHRMDRIITLIPAFLNRGGRGYLAGVLDLRLVQVKLVLMPCIVWEAVPDQVLCGFEAVVDFDALGFALHCADKECGDGVAFPSAVDDVLL